MATLKRPILNYTRAAVSILLSISVSLSKVWSSQFGSLISYYLVGCLGVKNFNMPVCDRNVPSNTNSWVVTLKLDILDLQWFNQIENIGNTVSATIPIAISILQDENKFSYSKKYLLMGFGVGLSVAGCIISWKISSL